jgi:hypothetical protein
MYHQSRCSDLLITLDNTTAQHNQPHCQAATLHYQGCDTPDELLARLALPALSIGDLITICQHYQLASTTDIISIALSAGSISTASTAVDASLDLGWST